MSQFKKYFLNALILSYLSIIYFSGVPETNTLNYRVKRAATQAAFVLGIWPSWSMFAPNPIKFDTKTYVEVNYKSGEKVREDVEIKLTGFFAPFRRARWMKYSQDNLRNTNQKGLLLPAFKHFKQKYYKENNPMVSLEIIREWMDVLRFDEDNISPILKKIERVKNSEVLLADTFKE